MKKLSVLSVLLFSAIFSFQVKAQGSIVDAAVGNEDFSTLVTALTAADLVSALQGDGPFTVFAPNNAAFGKLDSATLNSLLEEENKAALAGILTYHVVSGKLAATDVVAALKKGNGKVTLPTLNGQNITVFKKMVKFGSKTPKGITAKLLPQM